MSPLFPIDERLSARRTAIATTPCRRSGDRRSARIPSISPAERSRCWAARWARSLYLSLAAEDRAEQRLGAVRSGCCAGASEGPLLLQSTETRKVGLSLLALCLRACAAYRCGREKRASVAMNSSRVAKSQCSASSERFSGRDLHLRAPPDPRLSRFDPPSVSHPGLPVDRVTPTLPRQL